MIFVNLIYGHFDILMSQYDQKNKSHAFQGCSKMVFRLHTARTENPESPQTHPSASVCHEYHSDTPQTPIRHPPDTLQWKEILTDDDTHKHTLPDILKQHLSVSKGVWRCLLAYVVVWWHLGFPGDVWGVSGGCLEDVWGYLGGNHGNLRCSDLSECIWVPSPCSMEPKH